MKFLISRPEKNIKNDKASDRGRGRWKTPLGKGGGIYIYRSVGRKNKKKESGRRRMTDEENVHGLVKKHPHFTHFFIFLAITYFIFL